MDPGSARQSNTFPKTLAENDFKPEAERAN